MFLKAHCPAIFYEELELSISRVTAGSLTTEARCIVLSGYFGCDTATREAHHADSTSVSTALSEGG